MDSDFDNPVYHSYKYGFSYKLKNPLPFLQKVSHIWWNVRAVVLYSQCQRGVEVVVGHVVADSKTNVCKFTLVSPESDVKIWT